MISFYKNIIIPLFLISLLAVSGCFLVKNSTFEDTYQNNSTPPGTIKIADNFYCDETEVRNVDWMEYVFWTGKIYGLSSEEYISVLPNIFDKNKTDTCKNTFSNNYLNNALYYIYPAVGISQKQAENYSKWRSDRVFEQFLIDLKKIKYDTAQNKDTYFSINRYYKGTLPSIISSEKPEYYPEYSLPTLEERKLILTYADSVALSYYSNCHSKKCKKCKEKYPIINSDKEPCDSVDLSIPTDIFSDFDCFIKKGNPLYNLRGNVSEWTSVKDISVGGSWSDKRKRILETDIFITKNANTRTGFRNICRWKKYKK